MNDNKSESKAPAAAPAAMDRPETVTVRLSRPITVAGQTTSELVIHEPTLRHYEVLDKLGLVIGVNNGKVELSNLGSVAVTAVRLLGGLTEKETAAIPMSDLGSIAGVVMDFFGISLPTGESG